MKDETVGVVGQASRLSGSNRAAGILSAELTFKKHRTTNSERRTPNVLALESFGERARPRARLAAPSRPTAGRGLTKGMPEVQPAPLCASDEGVAGCARGGRAPQSIHISPRLGATVRGGEFLQAGRLFHCQRRREALGVTTGLKWVWASFSDKNDVFSCHNALVCASFCTT